MTVLIKIRKKPTKPVRDYQDHYYKLRRDSRKSLQDVIDALEKKAGRPLSLDQISIGDGWNYIEFKAKTKETIEEYEVRLDQWRRKVADYEAWYKANEPLIKQELARRERMKVEQEQQARQREKKRLQQQMKSLQKQIEQVQAKLQ